MKLKTFAVDAEAVIQIEDVDGDLQVEGWDEAKVQASGSQLTLNSRAMDAADIYCRGDLTLTIPRTAQLKVGRVGGNARLQILAGEVQIGPVGGDLELKHLHGPVRLSTDIGGEVHMQDVNNVSMSGGGSGPGAELRQNIRRKIQQAARHADKAVQRAESRLRMVDAMRWRSSGAAGVEAAPAGQETSDEERLAVLKMLQEKKITAEQAEKLLSALEGNAG